MFHKEVAECGGTEAAAARKESISSPKVTRPRKWILDLVYDNGQSVFSTENYHLGSGQWGGRICGEGQRSYNL